MTHAEVKHGVRFKQTYRNKLSSSVEYEFRFIDNPIYGGWHLNSDGLYLCSIVFTRTRFKWTAHILYKMVKGSVLLSDCQIISSSLSINDNDTTATTTTGNPTK